MATREGAIRVSLRDGSFRSQFKRTTSFVSAQGKKMGRAVSGPISSGLSSAKKSITGMFASLNSKIKGTISLAGGLATGVMIKNALDLQGTYRDIAFTLEKLPGEAMSWAEVQDMVTKAADKTGQKSEALAAAFHSVVRATGDLSYSAESVGAIGTAATASGESTESLAKAAELMQRKFGIGNDEIKSGLASFLQLTGSGGKSLDELTGKFAVMAGEAASAGMKGVPGLQTLLGLLLNLDSTIGEKADPGLKMMFQTLKKGSAQLIRLQKEGKIKFEADATGLDKIRTLLTTKKARAAAEVVFTADARQVFDTLARPFDEAFKEAQEKGMGHVEAVDAGLRAFDDNIKKASRVTMTYADVQKKASARMKDDPSVKLRRAIEKVEQAFAQPAMIEALDTLADKLPALAEQLGDLIKWITENPKTAIAAGVGLKVGGAALGGIAGAAGTKLLGKIGLGAAAKGAAGAGAAGAGAAGTGGAAALAAPAAAVLGAGIAGAGAGYALHKLVFDPRSKDYNKKMRAAEQAASLGATVGNQRTSVQEKKDAIQYLATIRKNLKQGRWTTENIMGELTSGVTGLESPSQRLERTMADLAKAQEELSRSLSAQLKAQTEGTDGVQKFTRELNQAGDSMRAAFPKTAGAPRGGNNLPPPKPGADPVKG